MSKNIITLSGLIVLFSLINQASASEYLARAGTIHTVKVVKGWCGNLAISTKVGRLVNGTCNFQKETVPYGYDGCVQYLNGGLLEEKVGLAFECGATHIRSNVDGSEALDEFRFILDQSGHYVGSQPAYSEVELKKQ